MLIDVYREIFSRLMVEHPELSRTEIRDLMAREVAQEMKPKYTEKQLIAWVNNILYKHNKPMIRTENTTKWENEGRFDEPGKSENGHYLPGYIDAIPAEKRQLRKAQSEAVRKLYSTAVSKYEYAVPAVKKNLNRPDLKLERWSQRLVVVENPTDPPEEKERIRKYNAEIAVLFGVDEVSKGEQQKWKDALKSKNQGMTDAEAEKALRVRRGQLLMDIVHQRMADVDRLDTMLNPDLTPEEMVADAEKVLDMLYLIEEAKSMTEASSRFFEVSAEDEAFLQRMARLEDLAGAKFNKVALIANPTYEFLDPDMLQYTPRDGLGDDAYDVYDDMRIGGTELSVGAWDRNDPDVADVFDEGLKAQAGVGDATGWTIVDNNPTDGLRSIDPYSEFFSNSSFYFSTHLQSLIQVPLENYGFPNEPGEQTYYMENDGFSLSESTKRLDKLGEAPFVAVRHNHYRMFQKQPDGSVEEVPAGTQLAYKLREKTAALSAQMAEADPPGHHGKNAFRQMREVFENFTNQIGTLELEPYRNRQILLDCCAELIGKADAYIATKQASLDYIKDRQENARKHGREYNPTKNERWDLRRTDMAKALKTFAQTKKKEIELAENVARAPKIKDWSTKNRLVKVARMDREWQANEQDQHTYEWLHQQLNEVYTGKNAEKVDIPENIISGLKPIADYSTEVLSDLVKTNTNELDGMIGRMIAAEQIMLEDSMLQGASNGKLRKFYANAKKEDFIKLAQETLCNIYNVDNRRELDSRQRERVLKKNNIKEIAAEMLDYSYLAINEFAMNERLRGYYLNPIHPMRSPEPDQYDNAVTKFVQDNIIDAFDVAKKDGPVTTDKDGNGIVKRDTACNLLANCVIASMLQMERKQRGWQAGPGVLEYMLANDPQGIEQLRQQVLTSDMFKFMNDDDYTVLNAEDGLKSKHIFEAIELYNDLKLSSDTFRLMVDRRYMIEDTVKYQNLAKLIDLQLPQQIADREYQNLMQSMAARQNERFYEKLQNELFFNDNDREIDEGELKVQFKTLDGKILDPSKPEDLARIVNGKPLYAARFNEGGELTGEFIVRGGPNPQIVSHEACDELNKALADYVAKKNIDASNAVFRMGIGSPLDINWDKAIDLNTVEGASYALTGKPVIVTFGPKQQVQFSYDPLTGVTVNSVEYQDISRAVENVGIPINGNKTVFNRADGSAFDIENLYNQRNDDYSYFMAGGSITATTEDGRQISITRRKDGAYVAAPTAHDRLVSFFNSEELNKLQRDIDVMREISSNKPSSKQYDNVEASLQALKLNQPQFGTEQFISDDMRGALTAMVNDITESADKFLTGEGYQPEQAHRLKFVNDIKKMAEHLRTLLADEQDSKQQAEKLKVTVPEKQDDVVIDSNDNNIIDSNDDDTINKGLAEMLYGNSDSFSLSEDDFMRNGNINDKESYRGMREKDSDTISLSESDLVPNENINNNQPEKPVDVPKANEPQPEKPVDAPKVDAPQPSREEIVNWLFRYQNYIKNGRKNNFSGYMAQLRKNGGAKVSRKEASRRMPYKPGLYTEDQLTNAGIDINVLKDSGALDKFLQAEDSIAKTEEPKVETKKVETKKKAPKVEKPMPEIKEEHDGNNFINSSSAKKAEKTVGPKVQKPLNRVDVNKFARYFNPSNYLADAKKLNEAQRKEFANASFRDAEKAKQDLNAGMDMIVEALSTPVSDENIAKLEQATPKAWAGLDELRDNHYNMPDLYHFLNDLTNTLVKATDQAKVQRVEESKQSVEPKPVEADSGQSSYLAKANELNEAQKAEETPKAEEAPKTEETPKTEVKKVEEPQPEAKAENVINEPKTEEPAEADFDPAKVNFDQSSYLARAKEANEMQKAFFADESASKFMSDLIREPMSELNTNMETIIEVLSAPINAKSLENLRQAISNATTNIEDALVWAGTGGPDPTVVNTFLSDLAAAISPAPKKVEEPLKTEEEPEQPVEQQSGMAGYLARAKELNEEQRKYFEKTETNEASLASMDISSNREQLRWRMNDIVAALNAPINEKNVGQLLQNIEFAQNRLENLRAYGYSVPALDTFLSELPNALPKPVVHPVVKQAVEMFRKLNGLYGELTDTTGTEDILRQMDANLPNPREGSYKTFTAARNAFADHIQNLQNPPELRKLIDTQVRIHNYVMNNTWQNIAVNNDNALIELMLAQETDSKLRALNTAKTRKNLATIGEYNEGKHNNKDRIEAAQNAWVKIYTHCENMKLVRNQINEVQAWLEKNGMADRMDELFWTAMNPNAKLEYIRYEAPEDQAKENANAAGPDVEQNVEVQQNIAEPKSLDVLKIEAEAIVQKMQDTDLLRNKDLLIGAMNTMIREIDSDNVYRLDAYLQVAVGTANRTDGVNEAIPELKDLFRDMSETVKVWKAKAKEPKQEVENVNNNVINDLSEQKAEEPKAENIGNNVINEQKAEEPKQSVEQEQKKAEAQPVAEEQQVVEEQKQDAKEENVINEQKAEEPKHPVEQEQKNENVKKFPEDKLQIEQQEGKPSSIYEARWYAKKQLEMLRNMRKDMSPNAREFMGDSLDRLEDVLSKMATEPIPYHRFTIADRATTCFKKAKAYMKRNKDKSLEPFSDSLKECVSGLNDVKYPDKWANVKSNDNKFETMYFQNDAYTNELRKESKKLVQMQLRIDDTKNTGNLFAFRLNSQLRKDLASFDAQRMCAESMERYPDRGVPGSDIKRNIVQYAIIKAILLNEQCNWPTSYGPIEQMILSDKFTGDRRNDTTDIEQLGKLVFNTKEVQDFYNNSTVRDMYEFIADQGYRDMANRIGPNMYKKLQETAKMQENAKKTNVNPNLKPSSRVAEVAIVAPPKEAEPKKPDVSKGEKGLKV